MHRRRFQVLVSRAVRSLPAGLLEQIENVAIVVEKRPNAEQLAMRDVKQGETLLGLYEGVPLTERGSSYGMVIPDRITLFQEPIEEMCDTDTEIGRQVQRTLVHEIAHHFGMRDEELMRLGWE